MNSPGLEELSDRQWADQRRQEESTSPCSPNVGNINDLRGLERGNPELLRPTLAALVNGQAHRFDPVRFRFIEALAQKALKQRASVSRMLEKKALQALSDYLDDYLAAREQAAALATEMASRHPEAVDEMGRLFDGGDFKGMGRLAGQLGGGKTREPGALAVLTREMQRRSASDPLAGKSSFEDELRRQEQNVLRSFAGAATGRVGGAGADGGPGASGEFGVMGHFRESLARRHSEKLVARAIQERPDNPGPLNPQALIVRSLSLMRDLSPGYASRFVSYMDTLLWLERAGGTSTSAKSKGARRRKS